MFTGVEKFFQTEIGRSENRRNLRRCLRPSECTGRAPLSNLSFLRSDLSSSSDIQMLPFRRHAVIDPYRLHHRAPAPVKEDVGMCVLWNEAACGGLFF